MKHLVISKHICHRHDTPFRLSFQTSLEKKRNSNVKFQTGHLTELAKTIDALGCFDLKMFRNCPIRIEIVTYTYFLSESPKKKKKNERYSKIQF
jgi:hypothetical protein